MKSQKELINNLRKNDNESWILLLDACRADMFDKVVDDKFNIVNNGDVNCTPDWFDEMFNGKINGHLFHGGDPINSIDAGASYNENNHFSKIPSHRIYNANNEYSLVVSGPKEVNQVVKLHITKDSSIDERLEALGYKESSEYNNNFNLNVVRYMQPHTPYRMLPLKKINQYGKNYHDSIKNMVRKGDLTFEQLKNFYIDNLIWSYNGAYDLIKFLKGDIIITSDHGECLGNCGDWFHGTNYHEHITNVPWMVIQ